MKRISLWALGLLALGWAGFAAAVDPDGWIPGRGAAVQPMTGPALQPGATSAGPELFPAAAVHDAIEVRPQVRYVQQAPELCPANCPEMQPVPAPRTAPPASVPVNRGYAVQPYQAPTPMQPLVRPAAYEAPRPQPTQMAQPPDLLPGIPAALVPAAAIPQVVAPESTPAPRMAPPPPAPQRPATPIYHVTCPVPEPARAAPPVVQSKVAVIHTVVEPAVPETIAYPPGQQNTIPPAPEAVAPAAPVVSAAPVVISPALPVQVVPQPQAFVKPAPQGVVEHQAPQPTVPTAIPMTVAVPLQQWTRPVPAAQPVPPVSYPVPAAMAQQPMVQHAPQPQPVAQPAPAPVQPAPMPAARTERHPLSQTQRMPAVQAIDPPSVAQTFAQPPARPVIQAVAAEVIYSAPVPAAEPVVEMSETVVEVPTEPSIQQAPMSVVETPVAPVPMPAAPTIQPTAAPARMIVPGKPVSRAQPGQRLPFDQGPPVGLAAEPVLPRQTPYTLSQPMTLNSAEPLPVGPPMPTADEAPTPTPVADPKAGPTPGEIKGTPTMHHHDVGDGWHLGDCCQDLWNCCCDLAGDGPTVTSSAGFLILKPYWKSNPAFATNSVAGALGSGVVTDFDYTTQFVPQFTLGMVGANDYGFRVGWWGFAARTSEFATVPNPGNIVSAAPLGLQIFSGAPGALAATSKLRFNVWDFEATELLESCNWYFLLTGGIRYAHISQDYSAILLDGTGAPLQAVAAGHNFNGAGPTVSLTGKRAIGSSRLYVFGSSRASVLFGGAKQSASGVLGGTGINEANVYASSDAVIPEAEVEIGVGWHRTVGRARLFAQAGLIGEVWYEAGNSSRSYITPVTGPSNGIFDSADNNLGLLGLDVRVGVNY